MEELFGQAIDYLARIINQFPENELVPAATYWTAMANLFGGKYEEAAPWFDRVLKDFPACIYLEDSAFRRAVCDYGLSRFEDSDRRLATFIAAYPKSLLMSEAIMMRADIAGSLGKLDDAVRQYKQAMSVPGLNIEFYNHCVFQAGRILSDNEDHQGMISLYRQYIDANREGANIPLAVYWIGVALWNQGEQQGAMEYYRGAVEKYGKDPATIGIDMILDELVARARSAPPEQGKKAWAEITESLSRAMRENDRVMELRLRRVMLYHPNIQPAEKERVIDGLLTEENIPKASPAVLETMLDHSRERKSEELMVKVADYIIANHTETDYALDARMILADLAMSRAKAADETEKRNQYYAEATKHLDVIRAVFATSGEAAQALMLLAQIYFEQQKYDKADECYKQVLGVKDWKNFWPEALYGRGECAVAQKQYEVASSYYERIYVMYGHYKKWAAKGYLRRADCLRRLYQTDKAAEVLQEMLADKELSAMPEGAQARDMLARLKG
jgi:TolA-binding protein